jgi:ATP-binding cassette subfamily B protein/subfamily B ATP-binding cassette protein MsbA
MLEVEPEILEIPGALVAKNLQGDLKFENVLFGYQENHTVLDHVSFHIHPGQRVALVGASGAGKSTILSLLLRLYDPQKGAVKIDDVDITHYQRESLRHEIGIVLQDTVLFGASIEENISYGKPDATREEVETAARHAHAHDFIMALPYGYETIIGEKGSTLSGGQRQRICLARAFIKCPSILILDEPTSAVDPESASLIRDAIAQVQDGKTTLFIAHQFFCMNQFDQILVLQKGHIVEHGSHKELLDRNGHYYALYRRQTALDNPLITQSVI